MNLEIVKRENDVAVRALLNFIGDTLTVLADLKELDSKLVKSCGAFIEKYCMEGFLCKFMDTKPQRILSGN